MKWIAAVLIFTLMTGCATLLMKDQEPIAVDSRPSGANAVVQCAGGTRDSTVTPGHVSLPRTARAIAALAAVGVVGVIGFVVDRRNGRAYRHFPDEINEALEPIR
jgi:hypothetical protein